MFESTSSECKKYKNISVILIHGTHVSSLKLNYKTMDKNQETSESGIKINIEQVKRRISHFNIDIEGKKGCIKRELS